MMRGMHDEDPPEELERQVAELGRKVIEAERLSAVMVEAQRYWMK